MVVDHPLAGLGLGGDQVNAGAVIAFSANSAFGDLENVAFGAVGNTRGETKNAFGAGYGSFSRPSPPTLPKIRRQSGLARRPQLFTPRPGESGGCSHGNVSVFESAQRSVCRCRGRRRRSSAPRRLQTKQSQGTPRADKAVRRARLCTSCLTRCVWLRSGRLRLDTRTSSYIIAGLADGRVGGTRRRARQE